MEYLVVRFCWRGRVPHCLGYFRIVVQCRLIDRDTIRPNNKAPSVPPRPLCINLSARWHIEDSSSSLPSAGKQQYVFIPPRAHNKWTSIMDFYLCPLSKLSPFCTCLCIYLLLFFFTFPCLTIYGVYIQVIR